MTPLARPDPCTPIPARAGIGLKARHYRDLLEQQPAVGFLEVHTENYMGRGGPSHRWLTALRECYPLSLHGVGLSLGSAGLLDKRHLARWAEAQDRYQPGLVSEHLAWSSAGGTYLNDLLPLPYTEESLEIFSLHVEEMQEALGRTVLIENPSSYMAYTHSPIPETDFLLEVRRRTGCGLLIDVNNVFVSAMNHGYDPEAYLDTFPPDAVREIHLAGHHEAHVNGQVLRIDDHGSQVRSEVWDLYGCLINRIGPRPTLIEWDNDVPDLSVLLAEAAKADAIMAHCEDMSHA